MDTINKEKIIIGELIKIYSEKGFQEDLEIHAKSIANKFNTLLNDLGPDQGLISRNSVRDIKYFSLVHRIKEPDSFREKFFRGNLLQMNFKEFKFNSGADVLRERIRVKATFKKCDDLIGVKILTDLNEDCKKVLTILKESEKYLNNERIVLDKKDLSAQPTIMKNGLEIYKIKGVLNGDYSFELQIKSKIVSAWGDMEHAIFYKDYFISPVKESTQATMNHIGKLLFQIDDFLISVRNANNEFKSNVDVSTFLSWFDENYSEIINTKLGGVGFKIDLISEALYHIKFNKKIKIGNLQFGDFTYKPKSEILKNYPLNIEVLKGFIACYKPSNRHKRKETFNAKTNPEGRWRMFTYDEIIARDKTSLDISWLKDKSLADLDNLPDPDVLANDIIENLEAGLESFREIMSILNTK